MPVVTGAVTGKDNKIEALEIGYLTHRPYVAADGCIERHAFVSHKEVMDDEQLAANNVRLNGEPLTIDRYQKMPQETREQLKHEALVQAGQPEKTTPAIQPAPVSRPRAAAGMRA